MRVIVLTFSRVTLAGKFFTIAAALRSGATRGESFEVWDESGECLARFEPGEGATVTEENYGDAPSAADLRELRDEDPECFATCGCSDPETCPCAGVQ